MVGTVCGMMVGLEKEEEGEREATLGQGPNSGIIALIAFLYRKSFSAGSYREALQQALTLVPFSIWPLQQTLSQPSVPHRHPPPDTDAQCHVSPAAILPSLNAPALPSRFAALRHTAS